MWQLRRSSQPGFQLLFLLSLAATGLLGVQCTPPPPHGQELMQHPGFESGVFTPWTVEYGSCTLAAKPFPDADPHSGNVLFHGGYEGEITSCRAYQDVSAVVFNADIENSAVSLQAPVWLRSWLHVNDFDDQILLRVRYLDEFWQEISSLRTLVAGDDRWLLREAMGLIPVGKRTMRVELEARFRRGTDNDGMADDTSLVL